MNEIVERPREIIARVHAERDVRWKELGSGEIADTVIEELKAAGFVIVPREPSMPMLAAACDDYERARGNQSYTGIWQSMIDKALK